MPDLGGVNWPALLSPGQVIQNLPTDYYKSLENKSNLDLRQAFQNGLPQRQDGSPDYDAMARTLFQLGGSGQVGNAVSLSNLDQQRQRLAATVRDQQLPPAGVPPVSPRPYEAPSYSTPSAAVPNATTQIPAAQPKDNRGPVTFGPEPPAAIVQAANLPPADQPTARAPMEQSQPQIQKDQSRLEPSAYPPKVVLPENSRGSSPLGLDPERQAQRDQLVYRATNPGFTKEYREANLKQLEAFDKNNSPTPEMKNYDAARRAGYQGSPQQFVLDQERQKAVEKKVGDAQGDQIADAINLGQSAYKRLQQLDVMEDALRRGQGNITTGPFADIALKSKQALGSLFGIDLKGVPEAEVVSKIGFGFSTQAVKEISNRPSQMEFVKGLENNPGLLLSPRGSFMMIDVLRQGAKSDAAIARLARDPANRADWQGTLDKYYAEHPIMSPFEKGRPLGDADLKILERTQYSPEDLRRFAQDAIQRGAPRDKVVQKLRELQGVGSKPVQ